jgi:hypothetical protein
VPILPEASGPARTKVLDCHVTVNFRIGRRSAAVVLAALVALIAAWIAVPPRSVPLYDGIGAPDEPYRYVQPPSGAKHTTAPVTATATSDAGQGTNQHAFYVNSDEVGPQVLLFISRGSLVVPAGVTSLRVDAAPLAADRQPAGGAIDGNLYRLGATSVPGASDNGAIAVGPNQQTGNCTISLRATSGRQPKPGFIYRPTPDAAWTRLSTARVGNDVYRTDLTGFGDYALAFFSSGAGSKSSSGQLAVEVGGGAVVLLGVLVLVIRMTRRRAAGAGDSGADAPADAP